MHSEMLVAVQPVNSRKHQGSVPLESALVQRDVQLCRELAGICSSISSLGSLQLEGSQPTILGVPRTMSHVRACHTASELSLQCATEYSNNLCRAPLQSSAEVFSLRITKKEELLGSKAMLENE